MMNAVVNPLSFLDLDAPSAPDGDERPSPRSVLEFLCPGEGGADLAVLRSPLTRAPRSPASTSG